MKKYPDMSLYTRKLNRELPRVHVPISTDRLSNRDVAGRTPHEIARQEFSIELCVDQG